MQLTYGYINVASAEKQVGPVPIGERRVPNVFDNNKFMMDVAYFNVFLFFDLKIIINSQIELVIGDKN